jgi:hypothetical protein
MRGKLLLERERRRRRMKMRRNRGLRVCKRSGHRVKIGYIFPFSSSSSSYSFSPLSLLRPFT